jgi:integrase
LRLLCNSFLTSKKSKLDGGELSPRTWQAYYQTCDLLLSHFGRDRRVDDLRPDDFEPFRALLAKRYGTVGLRNAVNCCRVVLKYAYDQRLIDRPVHYGQSFNRPSAKALRKARNEAGPRLFEAHEVRHILEKADVPLRAMVLLGVNAGFGNTDIATLPQGGLDVNGGWINFPRPKTEIPRRVPLWPETVVALRKAIAERPEPKDPADANLVFLTRTGKRWVRVQSKRNGEQQAGPGNRAEAVISLDALSQRFAKLLSDLKINGRRGLGFYTLRHVFETIAGDSKDQVAVNSIMGHVDTSMAGVYRERISDERLRAVTEHVRAWLFDAAARDEKSITPAVALDLEPAALEVEA